MTRIFCTIVLITWIKLSSAILTPDECPLGSEYDRGVCVLCRVGRYRDVSMGLVCLPCPDGLLTADTGAVHREQCVVPYGSRTGRCNNGYYWAGLLEHCEPCAVGTYRDGGTDYSCVACPEGTSTLLPGQTSQDACRGRCPAGKEWATAMGECAPCPRGTYSDSAGYEECVACDAGHVTHSEGAVSPAACYGSDDDIFTEAECPLGTSWSPLKRVCGVCPQGYYRGAGGVACVRCPPETDTLQPGAKAASLCMSVQQLRHVQQGLESHIHCPLGTEIGVVMDGCTPCPLGTFRQHPYQPECQPCPDALTTPTVGSKHVKDCGLSRPSSDLLSVSSYDACPAGTDYNSTDSTCFPCGFGMYRSSAYTQCVECLPGYTTAMQGAAFVEQCNIPVPHGLSVAFFIECDCPVGTEWSERLGGCLVCGTAYYGRAETCSPCPLGYVTLSTGSKNIDQCMMDLTQLKYSTTPALGCMAGMEVRHMGLCEPCPVGTYKPQHGPGWCTVCPEGSPTVQAGSTSLAACVTGLVIEDLWPREGFAVGGQALTLLIRTPGQDLRVAAITAAGVACYPHSHIINAGEVECILDKTRTPSNGKVQIVIAWGDTTVTYTTQHDYHILPTPVIRRVHRTEFFVSGVNDVVLDTDNGWSVSNARALWYQQGSKSHDYITTCSLSSEGNLLCPIPDLQDQLPFKDTDDKSRRKRTSEQTDTLNLIHLHLGIALDQWDFYRNLTDVFGAASSVVVYEDPVVFKFVEPETELFGEDYSLVEFQGKYLNYGCIKEDYEISIGDYNCAVEELTESAILCQMSTLHVSLMDEHVLYSAEVHIGSLVYQPGLVRSPYKNNTLTKPTEATNSKHVTVPPPPTKPPLKAAKPLQQARTGNDDDIKVIVPAVVGALSLLVILVLLLVLYNKKKRAKVQVHEPISSIEEEASHWQAHSHMQGVDEAALPPLPVVSVFGPGRRTHYNGRTMRPLALPIDLPNTPIYTPSVSRASTDTDYSGISPSTSDTDSQCTLEDNHSLSNSFTMPDQH